MKKKRYPNVLRRLGIASLIVTIIFIIAWFVSLTVSAGKLDIYLPEGNNAADFKPESDIITVTADPSDSRHMIITGKTAGKVYIVNTAESNELNFNAFEYVQIFPNGVIRDMSNGNFSGYRLHIMLVQMYLLIITILIGASFLIRCKKELFSYNTLYFGGLTLFLTGVSGIMILSVIKALSSHGYAMINLYSGIANADSFFMMLSSPFMIIFSISLTISNIMLMKHEGKRFSNLLGLIMSGMIIGGYILYFIISRYLSGSEMQVRLMQTAISIYTTSFVYFESILLSAMICGLIAAKRKPAYHKTHVVILGCAIAADGTPLPLLRGRIDRAVAFAKEQKKKTGKQIIFVPSGGKGSDEVISEAESMKNYLLAQGIPEKQIIMENQSVNTQENMRFSLQKIKADCKHPHIIFSTSNYHVLRSGIISRNEGLHAEGIGCQTKWYFWPNAFIREFVGLLASKWRQHVLWMAAFIAVFIVLNMVVPM